MIHKNRGNRRKQNVKKALRKARIIKNLNNYWNYPCLHSLSKNKIHCSCPWCSAKTNDSLNKSKGLVNKDRGSRIPTTHSRYGRKNWKISDRKKIDSMNYQLIEYRRQ